MYGPKHRGGMYLEPRGRKTPTCWPPFARVNVHRGEGKNTKSGKMKRFTTSPIVRIFSQLAATPSRHVLTTRLLDHLKLPLLAELRFALVVPAWGNPQFMTSTAGKCKYQRKKHINTEIYIVSISMLWFVLTLLRVLLVFAPRLASNGIANPL